MHRISYVVEALLEIVFKFELEAQKPIIGSALTRSQIEVLRALISKPQMFNFINGYNVFRSRRLPWTLELLQELVEEATAKNDVDD